MTLSIEITLHLSGHRRSDPFEPFSPEPPNVAGERWVVVLEVGS